MIWKVHCFYCCINNTANAVSFRSLCITEILYKTHLEKQKILCINQSVMKLPLSYTANVASRQAYQIKTEVVYSQLFILRSLFFLVLRGCFIKTKISVVS